MWNLVNVVRELGHCVLLMIMTIGIALVSVGKTQGWCSSISSENGAQQCNNDYVLYHNNHGTGLVILSHRAVGYSDNVVACMLTQYESSYISIRCALLSHHSPVCRRSVPLLLCSATQLTDGLQSLAIHVLLLWK